MKPIVNVYGEGAKHLASGTGIVYRKWVEHPPQLMPGALVVVRAGDYEGCALWEPEGPVALRVVSHWGCPYSTPEEAIRDRLEMALKARERSGLAETGSFRLVNSDGDLLSGLIIDVFGGDVAVLQSSSYAIDAHLDLIARLLVDTVDVRNVLEKSLQRSRRAIGLEPRKRWIIGRRKRVTIDELGVKFIVDVEMGQKTGFYLDQRMNRMELRRYVEGGESVLDVFSYTGGFGLHALHAGAKRAVFIEEDPEAARLLHENLRLNGFRDYEIRNVSLWSLENTRLGSGFDVVIVDPPAFIQSGDEASIKRGIRAYRRAYTWSLTQGAEQHVAFYSSCSYFLDRRMFTRVIRDVMSSQKADYWLLGSLRGAAPDHVYRAAEYLDYLKGAFMYIEKRGGG